MGDSLRLMYAGQLAKDPEMRYTPQGTAVTNFDVAYNNKYNDKEETTWLRCTVWGAKAEAANQWLQKGSKISFVGSLKPDPDTGGPRIWTDQNGNPRASYEVNVFELTFLGDLRQGGSKQDDVPFDQDTESPTHADNMFD